MKMNISKQLLFVSLGVLFWFVAAMIVRFLDNAVFTENNPYLILMFILTIPLTFGFLFITQKVANLQKTELLNPIVIITYTAAFLDGIAMTWFRKLYSESFEVSFYGSALILWGVGMGLFLAYLLTNKNAQAESSH